MIRIMVVDDHQLLIDGIKTTLQGNELIEIVAEANNGQQALRRAMETEIDVVLMDINMPVMDGLDCTRALTSKYPGIKVIALSQYPEKRFVRNMLKRGASGYLLKDTSKEELVEAIRTVYEGGTYLNERLSATFNFTRDKSEGSKLFPKLTAREMEILRFISLEYSTQEIADRLFISIHTVETHRANMMVKAGARNTAGLIRWASENDLLD